jgi:hypothetical protein
MPSNTWTPQRERQYEHVLESCLERRPLAVCRKIAAATVNKTRAVKGESATVGCHCPKGTRPLAADKKRCYNPKTRRRPRRRCVALLPGQRRR